MCFVSAWGANYSTLSGCSVTCDAFSITQGTEQDVTLKLTNLDAIESAFQVDVTLPAGLDPVAVGSEYAVPVGSATVTSRYENSTRTLCLLVTATAEQWAAGSGQAVARIRLKATDSFTQSGSLTFSNMIFTRQSDEKGYFGTTTTAAVTPIIPVSGLTLSATNCTIHVGGTYQLMAIVTPSNASNQSVSWTSSNTSVATVSSDGLVTARAVGTATITATTQDGSNLSATCAITVTPQPASGITLSQTTASVVVDKTLQLSATVSPSAASQVVIWTSSNTNIATVSSNGLVTAKAVGSATITATTADGTNLSASCQLTVTPQLATGITLSQSTASLVVDKTLQLTATVTPGNTTNKAVTWTSNNTNIATVSSDGLVTAKGVGTATITATTADGSNLSASCAITVTPQLATGITLNQTSAEIGINETLTLVATITPENTTNQNLLWSTSNNSIASVTRGVVKGLSEGECIITATTLDGTNLSATCHVVVTNGSTQQGDNYLAVDGVGDVVAGQEFVISVALINQDPITAIQADLYLPNGIVSPNYNEDDEFVVLEESRKGRGHSVSTTVNDLVTRIVASSSRNAAFLGNEGTVMYIYLKMNDNISAGSYGIDLKNIYLTTTGGQLIPAPDVSVNIGAVSHHNGDANGDGFVDDTDYTITVRYLLAQTVSNFMFDAADMSGDGYIRVDDLPLIVDAALAFDWGPYQSPRRAPAQASSNNSLYISDFDMEANKSKTLSINLDNATTFTAMQCDVTLPAGMSIVQQTDEWGDPTYATIVTTRSNDHEVWTDITDRGDVRIIVANSNNKNIKGSSGAVAKIKVKTNSSFSGEHELVLRNIVCANSGATRYALPNTICRINHVDSMPGDVDGNGEVNGTDLNILINIILGKDNADNYNGRANVDGQGGIDGSDLNALINIILGK